MALEAPLLTIAIPTYNRSRFLENALHHLYIQIKDRDFPIEIIVSDNCSTDNTSDVVNDFLGKGLPIRYIKNKENKGADFNVAQCFSEATGKYVVAFGDDDVLFNGSIEQILKILSQGEYGMVYLSPLALKEYTPESQSAGFEVVEFETFNDPAEYFKKVSYYITFISANIVNRKFVNEINIYDGVGTNLVQIPLFCHAIFHSVYNIHVKTKFVGAADVENSGGYSIFEVFGKNFLDIVTPQLKGTKYSFLINFLKNDLLCNLFPFWITTLKKNSGGYDLSDLSVLNKHFGHHLKYWIIVYPMFKLPASLSKIYYSLMVRTKIAK